MKKYSVLGNKKRVTMEINQSRLSVIGNNCIVRVTINQGDIEVIGNDCRVEVEDNYGSINIVGNGGRVVVTKRQKGDKVSLLGLNGHLQVNGKENPLPSYEAQLSPFSKELDNVIDSIFTFVMR